MDWVLLLLRQSADRNDGSTPHVVVFLIDKFCLKQKQVLALLKIKKPLENQ